MTISREQLVCLESTPVYHVICRCVRRAFLCGKDKFTGQSFEHRRGWIEDELHRLSGIFAIDLMGYAVMSNHYHAVLHINQDQALNWSFDEVIDRWGQLYAIPDLVSSYLSGEDSSPGCADAVNTLVETWRKRLLSLSWFMKVMNFNIAVQANKEDDCTGKFWEGRFKSQALLDDAAVLQCMAYVDLNPIRAQMADTPEQSVHTSIQYRLSHEIHQLMPFREEGQTHLEDYKDVIPFNFKDYMELVDWTGRVIRQDKLGAIPEHYPAILDRLGHDPKQWLVKMTNKPSWTQKALGSADKIMAYCKAIGQKWLWKWPDRLT